MGNAIRYWLRHFIAIAVCLNAVAAKADDFTVSQATEFFENHCFDCHQGKDPEAGLDLQTLPLGLETPDALRHWVRIYDRVQQGEMPPPDDGELGDDDRSRFLRHVGGQIRKYQNAKHASEGRVVSRRLTRMQLERTLHKQLGIDIPLAEYLPEELRRSGYSTFADGQAMSHFQMQSHLAVVDRALDEAFRRALSPKDEYERSFDPQGIARSNPKRRCREPEMREGKAVIWNGRVIFYGRIPATTAPSDGWYRFSLTASALRPPDHGGVWSTVRTGPCVSSAPLLTHVTSFEATTEPKTIKFEAWLPKGHMLEIRPGDATLKRGKFAGGQIGAGEGESQDIAGIAFEHLTMQRFHRGPDNDEVRRLLFGDATLGRSSDSHAELERLLLRFATRAFRRPVDVDTIWPYVVAARTQLANAVLQSHVNAKTEDAAVGNTRPPFVDALRFGYRAILCSPRFLYFTENPGQLDAHEVATRLSYFLTACPPDQQLKSLAKSGELLEPEVLSSQVERLLGSSTFVEDFAAEWLDLDKLDGQILERKLYPEFDPVVGQSMLDETHAYLQYMLGENVSVARFVDGDFTFINSRLARYYRIEGGEGEGLQHVSLPSDSVRGGLLTHGSILKVTANGSNTSPVLRGVWMCERLLGIHIPPAPDNVPTLEPDTRGASTIREQLERHRSNDACASCHRKIDPPGFALENFDAAGQYREYYRMKKGDKDRSKVKVDASYSLPNGREFRDIGEFRKLIASDERRLARNVVENLIAYGTGKPASFADREIVDGIVDEVANDDFGFRSIIKAVTASRIFLNK